MSPSPTVALLGGALVVYALLGCASRVPEEQSTWKPAPPRRGLFKDSYFKSTIIHTNGKSPATFEGSTIEDSFVFMNDGGFRAIGGPGAPDGARGNDSYIHDTAIVEETTKRPTP